MTIGGVSQGNIASYTFADPQDDDIYIDVVFSGVPPSVQISGAETFSGANGVYAFESEHRDPPDEWWQSGYQIYRKDATWSIRREFRVELSGDVWEDMTAISDTVGTRYANVFSGAFTGADVYIDTQDYIDTASAALV